jgi:hypothetical protein
MQSFRPTITPSGKERKFNAARKLKLKQLLRAALKMNYEQKMFLQIAGEGGYEALRSLDMEDIIRNSRERKMKKTRLSGEVPQPMF